MIIEITASKALTEMKLGPLVGKKGVIIEANPASTGYYVKLAEPFMAYNEWFIPNESIKKL